MSEKHAWLNDVEAGANKLTPLDRIGLDSNESIYDAVRPSFAENYINKKYELSKGAHHKDPELGA